MNNGAPHDHDNYIIVVGLLLSRASHGARHIGYLYYCVNNLVAVIANVSARLLQK